MHFGRDVIETETIVYRSITGTVRKIHGEHREFEKFPASTDRARRSRPTSSGRLPG